MRKKVMVSVLTVLLMAVTLLAACGPVVSAWQEQYDLGRRYLMEGNYQEAVIPFTAAIEIDPKQQPAYVGRGDAYLGLASYEQAQTDYETALDMQEDPSLYLRLSNNQLGQGSKEEAISILQQGYEQTQQTMLQERAEALQHSAALSGSVFAWGENYLGTPLADAIVTLRDPETGEVILSYRGDENGGYDGEIPAGHYHVFVHKEGYEPVTIDEEFEEDGEFHLENIYLIPKAEGTGAIHGVILDAVTGEAIPDAYVLILPNWNTKVSGDAESAAAENSSVSSVDAGEQTVLSAVSDQTGTVTFPDQNFGYYTMIASKDGYVSNQVNIVVSDVYETEWNITLSPVLSDQQLRVVLTWGSDPEDLDSHLVIDQGDFAGGWFSASDVYYENMDCYAGEELLAELDVDDTDYYGPETITIHQLTGHQYFYAVHDFTNADSPSSTVLSRSNASVTVYSGDRILGVFHVPSGQAGTVWNVFSIDRDGTLTGTNTISYLYAD